MDKEVQFTSEEIVSEKNIAKTVGSGDLEVYATPAMAALMENAAMNAVASELPENSTTVGASLEISHNRPSGMGEKITATAVLDEIDGRKLVFSIEASDSKGVIGFGKHIRFIVDKERFLSKLR